MQRNDTHLEVEGACVRTGTEESHARRAAPVRCVSRVIRRLGHPCLSVELTDSTPTRPGWDATVPRVSNLLTVKRRFTAHVEFAHRAGLNGHFGDRDRGRDREGGGIDHLDRTTIELRGVHLGELEDEGARDLSLGV